MFFLNRDHEELFKQSITALNSQDVYYREFAYVAAAIQKKEILDALKDHSIDYELILKMSEKWSHSERAMLEVAWQLFNGGNLYDENDEIQFSTIISIFRPLDSDNSRVVLEAISRKYL